jgi:hypothetical protein
MNRIAITAAIQNSAVRPGTHGRSSLLLCMGACLGAALLLSLPQIAHANKKSPALPAAVFAAKTIYIDNQTNVAELQDDAYMGLAKWGHFEVVDSAQKADMVLRLTGTGYAQIVPSDTPPDMSVKPGSAHAGGNAVLPNGDEAAPDGFTRLTLIDSKSGTALWSDLSKTNRPAAAARMMDGLREAFEQGLKARGK